jgi:hypothetical protein
MKVIEFHNESEFPSFNNFRQHILQKYRGRSITLNIYKMEIAEEFSQFNSTYEAKYDHTGVFKTYITFPTEEDYLHFCLKWS